jgi:hypothetical protein
MSQSRQEPRDAIDRIEISSPCTVPWDVMKGDDRVRFCGQCRQNVYNVEALGRGEARRLIAETEGRACVRILRRPDGTVVTADCWARLRAARRRGIVPFLAMLLVVGVAELAAVSFGLFALGELLGKAFPVRSEAPRFDVSVDRLARTAGAAVPTFLMGPPPPPDPARKRTPTRPRKMGQAKAAAPQYLAGLPRRE